MKRSSAQVADQIARLEMARAAMMPDRRVLAEIDVQIRFLRDGAWTARIPEEVMARELAERWLHGVSDIEPAAHWEQLARMWAQQISNQDHNPMSLPTLSGIELIAAERKRQIDEEGWTSAHDDAHTNASMSQAAACYAETAQIQVEKKIPKLPPCYIHKQWPWERTWWKPSNDPVRNLVKAAALLAAEIDRIQRLRAAQATKN